ncbi:L,D-transpeptidase [Streptomyces hesseae]|uniref:L,D-transpeptidase n=1 Tax=Streptomyces hesseae TaxID=3075519 RepID=A0ABU2STI7_9ACTN|nr:L,D-transpeptidase [Streptomyces sp. DSM 40473]MDT0452322.1 L,D-transpeptidase [Streptomyces sp. DSM 40473]
MPKNNITTRRPARTVAAALTVASLVALAGPVATAQADGKDSHKGAKGSHAAKHSGIGLLSLKFVKNRANHRNSRLYVMRDGSPVKSYRAGSGWGEKATEECVVDQGWLPSGSYRIGGYERHHDSKIKGYAISLSDTVCEDKKTARKGLFIHSEMTRDGGRGRDESQRWDGEKDYNSNGCIKLSPDDIKGMYKWFEKNGWPKTLKVVG